MAIGHSTKNIQKGAIDARNKIYIISAISKFVITQTNKQIYEAENRITIHHSLHKKRKKNTTSRTRFTQAKINVQIPVSDIFTSIHLTFSLCAEMPLADAA